MPELIGSQTGEAFVEIYAQNRKQFLNRKQMFTKGCLGQTIENLESSASEIVRIFILKMIFNKFIEEEFVCNCENSFKY